MVENKSQWDNKMKIMPTSSEVPEDPMGPKGFGKCAVLVKRPTTVITKDCFEFPTRAVPEELEEGTVLVKHILVSCDPTHRIWMSNMTQYMPSVGLNTIMRAGTTARVVKTSDESKMAVGTVITCVGGVCEYSVQKFSDCQPVIPGTPVGWSQSALSLGSGHTAWIGYKICGPKAGETYVVSAASGVVGSIAA